MLPIIKKELKSYFDHPTAYILIVFFLVINSFFYFRTVYTAGLLDLRPMFDFLPWILLFFVPAITMKLLAEEKQTKTLELALAQPVRLWQLLVGKLASSVIFTAITLMLTLTIPLMLSSGGSFDWGQILAQYLAALLLILALGALGLAASSFSKNQVISFMIAIVSSFFFYVVGLDLVAIETSGILRKIFGDLSLFTHYNNLARGLIDLRDGLYFLSFVFVFLALAYFILERNRVNRKRREYRQLQIGVILLIVIAISLNLLGENISGRIDLTRGQVFTLSPASKNLLAALDDLVTIKVYASESLPSQVELLKRDVADLLHDLEKSAGGNIKVSSINVKEGEQSANEAQTLGITAVQFNILKNEQFTVQKGYFGLAVIYAGSHETIPFISDTTNLEYKLMSLIRQLTVKDKTKVAFLTGHGEKNSVSGLALFTSELNKQHEVSDVDLSQNEAGLANVNTLVIAGPTAEINSEEREKIKNFLQSGGQALFLINTVVVSPQNMLATTNPFSFSDFLAELGVKVNTDLVFDPAAAESITFGGGLVTFVLPYPLWPRVMAVDGNPITGDVQNILLPWASSLTLVNHDDKEVIEIFKTSDQAGSQLDNFNINPDQSWSPAGDGQSYLMAAALNWTDQNQNEATNLSQTTKRLVVIGNANFLDDNFVSSPSGASNLIFGLNAVDWLTQDDALITIRSKNRQPAVLILPGKTQTRVRYLNLIGLPVLVSIYGATRLFLRRRKTRKVYSL